MPVNKNRGRQASKDEIIEGENKTMKKMLALLLAMLMLVSVSATAFADNEETVDMAFPETGLTLHVPWDAVVGDDCVGTMGPLVAEEIGYNSGVYLTQLIYMREGDVFDPEGYAPFLTFLCLRDNCDEAVLNDPDFMRLIPGEGLDGLVQVGEYTHYVAVGANELPGCFSEAEVNWYNHLMEYADEIIENADYYAPQDPYAEMSGTPVSFQTMDLDGNPVSSEELFAANQITMLNIWETGCGPCKGELGDLAQIHQRLQEMGCGIVGLLWDSDMPGSLDEAKQLLANAGATYPSIQCPSNFDDLFDISGFPTSVFIDSNGRIIGKPVVGAQVDKYEEAIMDLLNRAEAGESDYAASGNSFTGKLGAVKNSAKAAAAPTEGTPYRIICVDENGNPVQGATIQFCSDVQCMMAKTDEDGVAVFDEAPGAYTVHLLKVPAGFAKDATEYTAPDVPGDLTIVMKAG